MITDRITPAPSKIEQALAMYDHGRKTNSFTHEFALDGAADFYRAISKKGMANARKAIETALLKREKKAGGELKAA